MHNRLMFQPNQAKTDQLKNSNTVGYIHVHVCKLHVPVTKYMYISHFVSQLPSFLPSKLGYYWTPVCTCMCCNYCSIKVLFIQHI